MKSFEEWGAVIDLLVFIPNKMARSPDTEHRIKSTIHLKL